VPSIYAVEISTVVPRMLKNIALLFLFSSLFASALVVPTDKPSRLLSLERGLFVDKAWPSSHQARALTLRNYYTPAMKKGGACIAVLFSAFVVALNIVLA